MKLEEGRKRDTAANALLALSFAASAAQSPKDLIRSGNIEGPGMQLMSRMMNKRKKATASGLDNPRVSEPARNRKMKTFEEFVAEAYLSEATRKEAEAKKQTKENPSDWVLNNTGSTENPNWGLKSKAARSAQAKRRADTIKSLTSDAERNAAKRKSQRAVRRGYEAHHITPLHHSAKLKASMTDTEWEQRKEQDAKDGIYHGHHPKNIMHTKGPNTPADRPGVTHRAGGAHEIEGKVKDIVSGSRISYRDLLAAAVKKQRQTERKKGTTGGETKSKSPFKEMYEIELEESSSGERMPRGSTGRRTGRALNQMKRDEKSTAAIARKAGIKGTGKLSTKDLKTKARDYTTYDSDDDYYDVGSTEQDHYIRTYSSARKAAKGERLISKLKPAGRTASGMTKLKTAPSSESVRKVKDLKTQMTKAGANKTGKVHTVDIMPRDSEFGKGDRAKQIERGKNFIQAIKDTPKQLKIASAKPGDAVTGKPTAVMSGEDKKTGEAKRAKLYGKIFGKRSTEKSEKTGLMVGKAD